MRQLPEWCARHRHGTLRGVWGCVRADIHRQLTMTPENAAYGDSAKRRVSALLRPEVSALALHRLSHYAHLRGWRTIARLFRRLNTLLHKNDISQETCIGPGCRMPHPPGMMLHMRAGAGLTMFSQSGALPADGVLGGPIERGPLIGDGVTVGGLSHVVGSVTVGDRARIGPALGVTRDVPSDVIMVTRRPKIRPVQAEEDVWTSPS